MSYFSEDEKYHNFLCVVRHIDMLERCPLTEDNLQEYMHYFGVMRESFHDLSLVSIDDIKDPSFRAAAVQGETYMQLLEQDFDPAVYRELLRVIYFMIEYSFKEDELSELMSSLNM
jgi:hypothetical protein